MSCAEQCHQFSGVPNESHKSVIHNAKFVHLRNLSLIAVELRGLNDWNTTALLVCVSEDWFGLASHR